MTNDQYVKLISLYVQNKNLNNTFLWVFKLWLGQNHLDNNDNIRVETNFYGQ